MGKNPNDYFERDSETHQKLAALKAEIKHLLWAHSHFPGKNI